MAARRRRIEYWAGLGAVLAAGAIAAARAWPVPDVVRGPVLNALLRDPVIVGMLRLAIVVAALYGIASVPALIVGGRWVKGLGTGGFIADEARVEIPAFVADVEREMAVLRADQERLTRERDDLLSLIEAETAPE